MQSANHCQITPNSLTSTRLTTARGECFRSESIVGYQDLRCRQKLKRRINNESAVLNNAVIERAIGEWHQRLCACVRAEGEHFEHVL